MADNTTGKSVELSTALKTKSFTVTAPPPTPITTKVTPVTTPVTPVVKSTPVNEQINNLIKQAEKSNTELNNKKIDFNSHSLKVKQVLKNCGMDSQMVERAYTLLKEL